MKETGTRSGESRVDAARRGGEIRRARPEEADLLSELAFRSKAVWGYSAEFMEACREELSLTEAEVRELPTFALEEDGGVVGFYALEPLSDGAVELGALFVEPSAIGRGFGRALLAHAREEARRLGHLTLVIQSDPNAARFYESAGGRVVGDRESASVPGRRLPLLELPLSQGVGSTLLRLPRAR
jgi:GNAT superfamily N-acetyltransferase